MRRRIASQPIVRNGTVAIWLLASLLVILGIVAIGMDGGRMMEERRQVQATADAAALAAAGELYAANFPTSPGSKGKGKGKGLGKKRRTAQEAALDIAKANGFDNDGKTSTVKVNIPPKAGEFAGRADHAEVIIQYNLSGAFSGVFKKKHLAGEGAGGGAGPEAAGGCGAAQAERGQRVSQRLGGLHAGQLADVRQFHALARLQEKEPGPGRRRRL